MNIRIKDIDSYILAQPEEYQQKLYELRAFIKSLVPNAEELISYNMPAFKLNGMLVGFAANKKHIGFYPWNGSTVTFFKDELSGYTTTKGSIHFLYPLPLAKALIKKIVLHRVKENKLKSNSKNKISK